MVLAALGRVMRTYPFSFGAGFSCVKTSFSDWLVQTQIEKRERIDWRRNGTFAAFGLFYLGGVQYAIYVPLFSRLFPGAARFAAAPLADKVKDAQGMRNLFSQVFLDQFVHHPLLYFPCFYALKDVINGGSVQKGLGKYANNCQEDLLALWKLWVPSTIINFALMPMHLRIPWVASTSLIWTCIISYMRGADDVETDAGKAMDSLGGNVGKPLLALYNLGVAAKPAYLYDKTKQHLLLTASGRDRIGFIHEVCDALNRRGSNVIDVNAYKVGREFVTIMLVEAEPSAVGEVEGTLRRLGGKGVTVAVQPTQPWLSDDDSPRCAGGVSYTGHLHATGPDRPGLMLRLTALLAEQQLDITKVSCHQHYQASLDGSGAPPRPVFRLDGVVRAFTPVDRAGLERALDLFEESEGVRIGITETDPDPSFSAFSESPNQGFGQASSTAARLKQTITGR